MFWQVSSCEASGSALGMPRCTLLMSSHPVYILKLLLAGMWVLQLLRDNSGVAPGIVWQGRGALCCAKFRCIFWDFLPKRTQIQKFCDIVCIMSKFKVHIFWHCGNIFVVFGTSCSNIEKSTQLWRKCALWVLSCIVFMSYTAGEKWNQIMVVWFKYGCCPCTRFQGYWAWRSVLLCLPGDVLVDTVLWQRWLWEAAITPVS